MISFNKLFALICLTLSSLQPAFSQVVPCPANIDFETGTFQHWNVQSGSVIQNIWYPNGTHTGFHGINSGSDTDYYGGFPIVAPGGGSYSLQLGNDVHGDFQKRARYYIHVPQGMSNYSFTYKMAVVVEDPSHSPSLQPKVVLRAYDSASTQPIPCTERIYVASNTMAGFSTSNNNPTVRYLPWNTGVIDLSGYAGNTVIVDVETYNCYAGVHFAYCYFDVVSCGSYGTSLLSCRLDSCGIILSAPGGYQSYQWYTSSWTPVATGQTVCVTPPSTPSPYFVVLTPFANVGCTDTLQTQPLADLSLQVATDSICFESGLPVQVTAITSGGIAPLSVQWSGQGLSCNNCLNPVITPTGGQKNIITATDSNGCFRRDTVTFIESNFTIDAGDSFVTCIGVPVNLNALVSPGSGNYFYSWSPAGGLSNVNALTPTFTPTSGLLGTATYVLRVDSGFCYKTDSITITTLPNDFSLSDTAICKGTIFQMASSGHPMFTYTWVPSLGVSNPNVVNPILNIDTTRTYTVMASYPTCPTIIKAVTIEVDPIPKVSLGPDLAKCQWDLLPVVANVTPSWFPNYTYTWVPAPPVPNTNVSHFLFSGQQSTGLSLTVTTPAGCMGKDSMHVTVHQGNFAAISPEDTAICPGNTVSLHATGGVLYDWTPGLYLSDSTKPLVSAQPPKDIEYELIVTDTNGCFDTVYTSIKVYSEGYLNLPDTVYLYPEESYEMNPGGNALYFIWSPPVGLSAPPGVNPTTISNPVAQPENNTRYMVRATTEGGCIVYDTIEVIIKDESLLDLPNAFSPASGTYNEVFRIIRRGAAVLKYLRIYNRWGNKVFETDNIDEGWDGRYNGVLQPVGTYVYVVEAVSSRGKTFKKSGNVTLIR